MVDAENFKELLIQQEQDLMRVALITSVLSLVIGAVLLGIGLWIYFKKIKKKSGQEKASGMLYVVCVLLIIIGALLLLNGVTGLISTLIAPALMRVLLGIPS